MKGAIMLSGGGSGKIFAAIGVTYPAGSTLTCTNGIKTLTAKTTSGQWVFAIPEAGTWTVTATDGTNSKSQSVSITAEGQFESVALSYRFYVFKSGEGLADGFTLKNTNPPYADMAMPSVSAEKISFTGTGTTAGSGAFFIEPPMDVSSYTKICFDVELSYNYGNIYGAYFGIGSTNAIDLTSANTMTAKAHIDNGIHPRQTVSAPFSSGITTKQYIKAMNSYSAGAIYNIWLE